MRKRHATLVLSAVLALQAAWPCGPVFPNNYLVHGGRSIAQMPAAVFYVECQRILNRAEPPGIPGRIHPTRKDLRRQTESVDLKEFQAATADRPDADDLLAEYTALRDALASHVGQWLQHVEETRWDWPRPDPDEKPPHFELQPYEKTIAKLPEEFAHYIRGAAAYHGGEYEEAIPHFEAVLALPEAERSYRSTWAAHMLGRCWTHVEPTQALPYFEQLRALAEAGFTDALNLAQDSLGWQALAETRAGKYLDALHHYGEFCANPGRFDSAQLSIKSVCTQVLEGETIDPALIEDPLTRKLITARALSREDHQDWATLWLAALDTWNPEGILEEADRFAWLAYQVGDMEAAAGWLAHCPPEVPYALWIKAKLLLRDGKLEGGSALLAKATQSIPGGAAWRVEDLGELDAWFSETTARSLAEEDLGYVLTKKGDYPNALHAFLRAGDWDDAALVAERILSVDELESIVKTPVAEPAVAGDTEQQDALPPAQRLRYLFARRLARNGNWMAAMRYFPEEAIRLGWNSGRMEEGELIRKAEELRTHLDAARAKDNPEGMRAEHFLEAGQIMREYGLELTGTELEPDWGDGNFDLDIAARPPEDPAQVSEFGAEFDRRFRASAASPGKRFHYRYHAADLLWEAAALLPNNDPLTAQALYSGGMYLQNRDPKAADRFYKALVRRNPNLLIAQQADQLRWFPKEFTDVVLYQPLPPFWQRHIPLLISGGATALILFLLALAAILRLRKPLGLQST